MSASGTWTQYPSTIRDVPISATGRVYRSDTGTGFVEELGNGSFVAGFLADIVPDEQLFGISEDELEWSLSFDGLTFDEATLFVETLDKRTEQIEHSPLMKTDEEAPFDEALDEIIKGLHILIEDVETAYELQDGQSRTSAALAIQQSIATSVAQLPIATLIRAAIQVDALSIQA